MTISDHSLYRPTDAHFTDVYRGRRLILREVLFSDHNTVERKWESVARRGTEGAVAIIAKLTPSERYILIEQYRPPSDALVLEFPAGLIDDGESPHETARRELYEETGYTGTISWVSSFTLSSPGMSSEGVYMALLEVDETSSENRNPTQNVEDTENISVFLKTTEETPAFLRECKKAGVLIDNRVASFFIGAAQRW